MVDLKILEKRMWDDMRKEWEYIDKIYVTQEEFDRLKDVRLSEEDMSPVLEALFRPAKRMFLDDVAFIISRADDLWRIIHLKYFGPEAAAMTVYDDMGDLFGKILVRINGDDVHIGPDKQHPVGTKYFERFFKSRIPDRPFETKQFMQDVYQACMRQMKTRMEDVVWFVFAAIHHVLTTIEVREAAPAAERIKMSSRRQSETSSSITRPRQLHRIIYQGRKPQQVRRKKEFIARVTSWKVRGHYRVTKTGKRVWVKPHVKGRKSDKYRPLGAEYRL